MAGEREMNVLGDAWTRESDDGPRQWKGMRVAGEGLAASLYELAPGGQIGAYHYELGHDELLVVVSGRPTLRQPAGERELAPGDCVLFPQGPEGAHQVLNRSDAPTRVLIVSNLTLPRGAVQLDTDKIMIRWGSGRDDSLWFRKKDAVDIWTGE